MKAKMIKVSAAVTADVLFILQAVGTNLLATALDVDDEKVIFRKAATFFAP